MKYDAELNINHIVKIKLTDWGREILKQRHNAFALRHPDYKSAYKPPIENDNGWSEWQLWGVMSTFGEYLTAGLEPPFETEIEMTIDVQL